MFIDFISNYRDDLTETNYAAILSQMSFSITSSIEISSSQLPTQLPQQHFYNFNCFDNQVNSQLFLNVQQFSKREIIITPKHQNRNNTFSYITSNQDDTSGGFPLL
jgi:hypothetical protein